MRIFRHHKRKHRQRAIGSGAVLHHFITRPRKLATKLGGVFYMQNPPPTTYNKKLRDSLRALALQRSLRRNASEIAAFKKPSYLKIRTRDQICHNRKKRREVLFANGKGAIIRKTSKNKWMPESRVRCN